MQVNRTSFCCRACPDAAALVREAGYLCCVAALAALTFAAIDSVRAGEQQSAAAGQTTSPGPVEASAHRHSVLVAFAFSAPSGVEDEIAKEHQLELVDKLALPTLGLRVVRYTIPDSRTLESVLVELRADRRVSSAQVNVEYEQIEPTPPTAVAEGPPRAGPLKAAKPRKTESRDVAVFGNSRPARSARIAVGDVLAGGL
jgi:hypothetical protein